MTPAGIPDPSPLERFVFSELASRATGDALAGPSLAGLNDQQLRKLVGDLQSELARVRNEKETLVALAHQEGLRLGLEQARSEIQASLLAAADCVNDALENIGEQITSRFETVVRDSAGLAFVVGEHLAAQVLSSEPLSVIEGALNAVLAEMHKLTDLEIEVHPSLVAPLEHALKSNSAANRKLNLMIYPDERLQPGDAQISWGEGGLKIEAAARRSVLLEALGVILPDEGAAKAA